SACVEFRFFFQAEDGIRDFHVTGVQTCALPIYVLNAALRRRTIGRAAGVRLAATDADVGVTCELGWCVNSEVPAQSGVGELEGRSEERRVGEQRPAKRQADEIERA